MEVTALWQINFPGTAVKKDVIKFEKAKKCISPSSGQDSAAIKRG
jgi:hypothetical protein